MQKLLSISVEYSDLLCSLWLYTKRLPHLIVFFDIQIDCEVFLELMNSFVRGDVDTVSVYNFFLLIFVTETAVLWCKINILAFSSRRDVFN